MSPNHISFYGLVTCMAHSPMNSCGFGDDSAADVAADRYEPDSAEHPCSARQRCICRDEDRAPRALVALYLAVRWRFYIPDFSPRAGARNLSKSGPEGPASGTPGPGKAWMPPRAHRGNGPRTGRPRCGATSATLLVSRRKCSIQNSDFTPSHELLSLI